MAAPSAAHRAAYTVLRRGVLWTERTFAIVMFFAAYAADSGLAETEKFNETQFKASSTRTISDTATSVDLWHRRPQNCFAVDRRPSCIVEIPGTS
jgi:hypothetical protein